MQITENVEILLPAGGAGIECFAGIKLHARDDKVQLVVPGVGMPDPKDVKLVWL